MNTAVLVGCGYVGTRLALQLKSLGIRVRALVRSAESQQRLAVPGIDARTIDLDTTAPTEPAVTDAVLYYLVPPPPEGTQDPRIRRFLAAIDGRAPPQRIVLISTTGVYGDCGGAWVDETWPLNPQADRARRRVDAEHAMTAWATARDVPWAILRVPGIYGPGKLPLARLREAKPVLREEESPWSSRVQVHDLVRACVAAGERGEGVYNVSDGHPSTMTDYFNRVADTFGLPRPPQLARADARASLSPEMWSYLEESRRVSNRRLREELGVVLQYEDLVAGLRASAGTGK